MQMMQIKSKSDKKLKKLMAFKDFKTNVMTAAILNIYWVSKHFKLLNKIFFLTKKNSALFKQNHYTVKPQWLEHLWDHGNSFEAWVVQATEG